MKVGVFRFASFLMILMAFAHFAQVHNGITIPNSSPESDQMLLLMKTYEIDVGMGVQKTMWQLLNGFILCWGLFVIMIGLLNLWAARFASYEDILISRLASTSFLGLAISIVISFIFFSWPVILFSSLVALLYLAAAAVPSTRV